MCYNHCGMSQRKIGLILSMGYVYSRRVFVGIQHYALERDWQLHLQDLGLHDPPAEWLHRGMDGFLIQVSRPELVAFEQIRPVINVSGYLHVPLPTITSDNRAIGAMAAEHLLSLPLSHFAYVGQEGPAFTTERGDGFSAALARAGYGCARFEKNVPYSEAARWMASLPRPLGLMASSDLYAGHLIRACTMAGLAIQEQFAIIGVDNEPAMCEMTVPSLSSVDVQAERIGYEAARMLDRRMRGLNAPSRRLVPLGVVQRDSTRLRAYDPEVDEALRLIGAADGTALRVEELAGRLGMERRTLERRFQRILGRSPRQEILQARLRRARHLLAASEMAMPEVARRCGFNSAIRFTTAFRSATGLTPTAFRRQLRSESMPHGSDSAEMP